MSKKDNNRIFWLGMHVVLTRTELPRLRALGHEVFNPPYNSPIYDQSANLDWDEAQPTTLPPAVFNTLRRTNFFYTDIDEHVAELLNTYFKTIIVTINPDWLASILKVFKGKVIYRTYGQPYKLSDALIPRRLWKDIVERDNFYLVPFAEETLDGEHQWLIDRSRVVPYTLPLDVFNYRDTWAHFDHEPEIMISVPNIANAYYASMYSHINTHFPEMHFRLYGVQPKIVNDVRVAGTLRRDDLMRSYQRAAGYFYPYHDEGVCYLPPIEMMTVGGPVVFHKNSLLHRMFKGKAPGLAEGITDQRAKTDLLLKQDRTFVDEVIASQEEVRRRYSPEYVNPILDAVFTELLSDSSPKCETVVISRPLVETAAPTGSRTWILAHFPGQVIRHDRGQAFASEGIPRVIGKVVEALVAASQTHIVVTCNSHSVAAVSDYFHAHIRSGRLSVYVVDAEALDHPSPADGNAGKRDPEHDAFVATLSAMSELSGGPFGPAALEMPIAEGVRRFALAAEINRCEGDCTVFVPHYYLFPEAMLLKKPLVLYLPDYTPHFFPGIAFDRSVERDVRNADVGRRLAAKARAILTNSEFTRDYLPACVLKVDPDKIHTVPMPLLIGSAHATHSADREFLESKLGGWQYIFYPTANRPNKQIAFLLRIFTEVVKKFPDLKLVLTCSLNDYQPAADEFDRLGISDYVVFLPGVSEGMMRWLYENAAALCITSTMEGNMPPQILEALAYRTPVVATRLPQIPEVLGDESRLLELAAPMAFYEFVSRLTSILSNRDKAVERQQGVVPTLAKANNMGRFSTMIANMFHEAAKTAS